MKPITEEDIRADIVRKVPGEDLESYPKVIFNFIFFFLHIKITQYSAEEMKKLQKETGISPTKQDFIESKLNVPIIENVNEIYSKKYFDRKIE